MSTIKKIKDSFERFFNQHSSGIFIAVMILMMILYLFILLNRAWVCDDSYITFRVVNNFHSGYGFRWNIAERVQVFTHPLWMIVMTFFYTFTKEVYLTSIFLNIILSIGVIIFLILLEKNNLGLLVGIFLLLCSSTFMDYSTSGLENPLSHCLLAFFLYYYLLDPKNYQLKRITILSIIAGFACLNRLDHLLIYAPILFYIIFQSKRQYQAIIRVCIGFIPLLVWSLFSVIYYGYLLPNTFYAKVGDWLTPDVLLWQGWQYFLHTLRNDPITGLTIVYGLVFAGINYKDERLPLAFGVLAYIFYVVWIGGDFMEGRFFTSIFLLSLVQVVHYDLRNVHFVDLGWILPLITLISLFTSVPTLAFSDTGFTETWEDGIVNERIFYAETTGLFRDGKLHSDHEHPWAEEGKKLNQRCKKSGVCHYVVHNIGFTGYAAGPAVYLVDHYGLGSALLARLSPEVDEEWRIGHFYRAVPNGYLPYLRTGDLDLIENPEIQRMVQQLDLLTSQPIFSAERFQLMLKFDPD